MSKTFARIHKTRKTQPQQTTFTTCIHCGTTFQAIGIEEDCGMCDQPGNDRWTNNGWVTQEHYPDYHPHHNPDETHLIEEYDALYAN